MSPRTRQLVPLTLAAVVACLLAVLLVSDYERLAVVLWVCSIVFIVAWFCGTPLRARIVRLLRRPPKQ